ncbi:MAG: ArsR family transcriptional regulator, partial [Jatrophihabitans sp.]
MGDSSRRQIVAALAARPRAVGELADGLPISRPAVSQHLRVLKDAGVVVDEAAGTRRVYRVDAVALSALKDQLDTFWRRTLAGFSEAAQTSLESSRHRAKGEGMSEVSSATVLRSVT